MPLKISDNPNVEHFSENKDNPQRAKKNKVYWRKILKLWPMLWEKAKALNTSPYTLINITLAGLLPPVIVGSLIATNSRGIASGLASGDPMAATFVVTSATSVLLATLALAVYGEMNRAKDVDRSRDAEAEASRKKLVELELKLAAVSNSVTDNSNTLEHLADKQLRAEMETYQGWEEYPNRIDRWSNLMPGSVYFMVNGAVRFDLHEHRDGNGNLVFVPDVERLGEMARRCVPKWALREWNIVNVGRYRKPSGKPPHALIRQVAAFKAMREIALANDIAFNSDNVRFHIGHWDEDCSEAFFVGERDLSTRKGHAFVIRYRTNFMGAVPTMMQEQELLTSSKPATVQSYREWAISLTKRRNVKCLTFDEALAVCEGYMPEIRMPDDLRCNALLLGRDSYVCNGDHFIV